MTRGPPDARHPGRRRRGCPGQVAAAARAAGARRVHGRAGGLRRPGRAGALAARGDADPRRRPDHCRVARPWLPGPGADRAGAAAVAARPAAGCRGRAHSGPHRPRRVRRRRRAAGGRGAGVRRGGVSRARRARDPRTRRLGPPGCCRAPRPDALAMADIRRGVAVARALGAVDVGQGCVVQQGMVLAVEAAEGTDAMLARCAALARPGRGGVLVKLVKPGQDRRADLPTIGPETIARRRGRRPARGCLRGRRHHSGRARRHHRRGRRGRAVSAGPRSG